MKKNVYNRTPFWLSTTGYFLYRYIFQLGFLDGKEGLVYHFLQGYWYRFLVGAKMFEYERAMTGLTSREARLAKLETLTGHRLLGGSAAVK